MPFAEPPQAAPWHEHRHASPAGTLHWRELGPATPPASTPTLVFVHGILANGHLWDEVAARLSPHARCVLPHWPLGAHPEPMHQCADLSVQGVVKLMCDFIDALGAGPVVLVGNDSGGALSQLFAVAHPERVRGLVLTPCDCYEVWLPTLFKPLEMAAFVPGALWLAATLLRVRALRRLPFAFGWMARRLPAALSDGFALPWARSRGIRRDLGKFLRDLGPRHTQRAAASFAQLGMPALVVWATDDRLFPPRLAERLARELPQATLRWVDDAYTFVAIDQPAKLAAAIEQFLGSRLSGAAA